MRLRHALACVAVIALSASAHAQQPRGEMTLFSGPEFTGARYVVTGPRTNITIPWPVRSLRIRRGERWELCPRTSYRGSCIIFDGNARDIRRNVASARPAFGIPLPIPEPPVGGGGAYGPSLRGMGAEFFARPRENGQRVISARNGSPGVAAQSADRFCVNRGWNGASTQAQETVGGQNYLVDVLCTRTGY